MCYQVKHLELINWENRTHEDFGKMIQPKMSESWRDCYLRLHEKIYTTELGLHKASSLNCERAIHDLIIRKGCNINQQDEYQMTPLALAVANNAHEAVEMLLRLQADVDHPAGPGKMIAFHYVRPASNEIAGLLINKMTTFQTGFLATAARNGNYSLLRLVIQRNLDINVRDKQGDTIINSLITLSFEGKVKVLKWLIQHGADVNIPNIRGISPLHLAMGTKDMESVNILLDAGAIVLARDNNGDNCIAWGLFEGSPETCMRAQRRELTFQAMLWSIKLATYSLRIYHIYQAIKQNIFGR